MYICTFFFGVCIYVLYNYCHNFMENQVPEDRLGRLEQEYRTLALELRLSISVAEEAATELFGLFCFSRRFDGQNEEKNWKYIKPDKFHRFF